MSVDPDKKSGKPWWAPIVRFFVHALCGSAIFAVIAIAAVGVGSLVHLFESWGVKGYSLSVFHFLEKALVTVDAALFLLYLGVGLWKALKDLNDDDH